MLVKVVTVTIGVGLSMVSSIEVLFSEDACIDSRLTTDCSSMHVVGLLVKSLPWEILRIQ